jgi:hypothetical protein
MASPLVDQFRKGGVSRDVRLSAASALLPLTPADQVELLYLLTRDQDEEIRGKAEASLTEVSQEDLTNVLNDRGVSPKVLHFYATRVESPELLQAIIQNQSAEDSSVQAIVPRLSVELLEIVVINQTRLLRHPPLIEALEENQSLSSDQRRRLNELKHDFKIGEQPEPVPAAEAPEAEQLMDLNEGPPEDEAPPPANIEQAMEIYGDDREDAELTEEEKTKRLSAYQKLVGMTPAEKMMEALKGERESRMILVRDRNRVVYSAVLSSPKLTDGDVAAFASMRNVSPEVLRTIGGKREYTKKYGIRKELVKNPLTPIEISMQLINRLSSMDLKRLTKDRNVPEQVRRQATKLIHKER